jgi:hypothetical protein
MAIPPMTSMTMSGFRIQPAAVWPALTWDYLREWRDVISQESAQVFRFERKMRTPAEKLECFERNQYRLIQRCRKPGGWIDVFRDNTIDRYWP